MMIDFIPPSKLPALVVWLDWNFYAYRPSLIVFLALALMHCHYTNSIHWPGLYWHGVFIGFCWWCVYCATRYGYAVG